MTNVIVFVIIVVAMLIGAWLYTKPKGGPR